MNFELDDDQIFLRDEFRALLETAVPIAKVRASRVDGFDADDPTWALLAHSGWLGLVASEIEGGTGLGFEEAMIVAMEAGRALLPVPLAETIVATRTIERHAPEDRRLHLVGEIVAGRLALTLALHDVSQSSGVDGGSVGAERSEHGWRLSGIAPAVSFGPLADACLVEVALRDEARDEAPAEGREQAQDDGRALLLLSNERLRGRWSERAFMDRTVRRFDLALDGLEIEDDDVLARFSTQAPELEEMRDEWRVLLAAEIEGASRRLLELTARYVVQREQFGRPVGANQAVKVRVAEMGAATERMRAAIYHAAMRIEQGAEDRALAAAMAKHAAGSGGAFVGSEAIHLHGALGFTWEQDIHLFVKRIKTNELLLGGERACLARIAEAVLDA